MTTISEITISDHPEFSEIKRKVATYPLSFGMNLEMQKINLICVVRHYKIDGSAALIPDIKIGLEASNEFWVDENGNRVPPNTQGAMPEVDFIWTRPNSGSEYGSGEITNMINMYVSLRDSQGRFNEIY